MKKHLFIIFIFISSIQMNAQVFKPGVILGLNTSQVSGDGYGGFHKIGFIFGVLVNSSKIGRAHV